MINSGLKTPKDYILRLKIKTGDMEATYITLLFHITNNIILSSV